MNTIRLSYYAITLLAVVSNRSVLSSPESSEHIPTIHSSSLISDSDRRILHQGHKQTDVIIDALQQTIGRVTDENQRFMLGVNLDNQQGLSKQELIEQLIDMQEHRMQYDSEFFWKYTRWCKKERDKTIIKSSLEPVVGIVKNIERFDPNLSALDSLFVQDERFNSIQYLPKKAKDIHAMTAITILQSAFASIPKTEGITFLGQSIQEIQDDLSRKYTFFDARANSWRCFMWPNEHRISFQYKKFLRTRLIPYLCFAQLQVHKQTPKKTEEYIPQTLESKSDDTDTNPLITAASTVLGAVLKSAISSGK